VVTRLSRDATRAVSIGIRFIVRDFSSPAVQFTMTESTHWLRAIDHQRYMEQLDGTVRGERIATDISLPSRLR